MAEGGYYPGVVLYLSKWLPSELLGTGNAVFVLAGARASLILNALGSVPTLRPQRS